MTIKFCVVQPITYVGEGEERNVVDAVHYIETAASEGADIVCFPESYPGPWRTPAEFDPTEAMAEAAKRCDIYVQYGTLEPVEPGSRTAYQISGLATPEGEIETYRRTHPQGPWLYHEDDAWSFDYIAGDDFPVFDSRIGRLGLEVCSEVYMPEVSRALALRGAEILFIPAGADKTTLWRTWRTLIWARAIENLAIVITTQNLIQPTDRGLAMVATPEQILFESSGAGMFYVDVDTAVIERLRSGHDFAAATNRAKAGVLTQWQRPELYRSILPEGRAAESVEDLRRTEKNGNA